MAKKLVFTLTADGMPEDEMDRAELLAKIKPARDAFVEAVMAIIPVKYEMKVMTSKAASTRKPRAAATGTARAAAE